MIHNIFLCFMEPAKTTIHYDSKASIQKLAERVKRLQESINKITHLHEQVKDMINNCKPVPPQLYTQCKQAYCMPHCIIDMILSELGCLGWRCCPCAYPSDTCIVKKAQESKLRIAVVSTDSDMMLYEDIDNVTIPFMCKGITTYYTYLKSRVLYHLNLTSPCHLLLTGVLLKSDYFSGILGLKFTDVAMIISDLELNLGWGHDHHGTQNDTQVSEIAHGIKQFFASVDNYQLKKSHPSSYNLQYLIDAFVRIHEDDSNSKAIASYDSHNSIKNLLITIHHHKVTYQQKKAIYPDKTGNLKDRGRNMDKEGARLKLKDGGDDMDEEGGEIKV